MPEAGSPTVLIVEDDDGVRGFLTFALERAGYAAVGVRTGEEAMAELHRTAAPVILIDGILPDMHGVRLARAILEEPGLEQVAISFVTGAIRDGRPAEAGLGALSKPLRVRDLTDAVETLLQWRDAGCSPVGERLAALARLEHLFLVGA
jgi:two-component system, cell cycle response regulator CpdR